MTEQQPHGSNPASRHACGGPATTWNGSRPRSRRLPELCGFRWTHRHAGSGGCRVDRAVAGRADARSAGGAAGGARAPLLAVLLRCDIAFLDGTASHLSNDGCGIRVIDPASGQLRAQCTSPPQPASDAVPQALRRGPVVTAEDVPRRGSRCTESRRYSRKHQQALPGSVHVVGEAMTPCRCRHGPRGGRRDQPPPADHDEQRSGGFQVALVCASWRRFLSLTLAAVWRRWPATSWSTSRPCSPASSCCNWRSAGGGRALRDGPQDRRLHRRQPRGLRPGRRRHTTGAPLRLRDEHGYHGERGGRSRLGKPPWTRSPRWPALRPARR